MADQFNRPYRGNDGPAPRQSAPASGGDPLAELARLIGQNDPFSDLGRNNAPARQPRYEHPEPQSDWRSAPESHQGGYGSAAPEDHYPARGSDRYDQPQGQPYQSDHYDPNSAPYDAQQLGEPRNFSGQDDEYPAYGDRGQRNRNYPEQALDPYATEPVPDFEEEEKPRRRSGLITAMAVLALALVGTAAAFGYRAIFSGPGNAAPPVIKADTAPAKVVPAAVPNEQSKQIYDRVGDKPQTERVVAREEAPVNVQAAVAAVPPPVQPAPAAAAAPNPIAPPPATLPPSASALAPTAPAGPISTEPKRVRTVTIRPDQPVAPAAAPAPVAAARPAPAIVQPATPQPAAPARVASAAPAEASAPAAPAPRPAATRSMAQKPPAGNAPLSLVPPSAVPAAQPHAVPMRTAAAPAAAASHGDAASYVQVSSQRTEAEAQSSFQTLRSKFPAVLGDRQPVIRRADLGDKGVFFRATVGPFGNVAQATEFCSSLKSAGGECVVQRN